MNIPIEKLGAACFSENLQLFANHQTNPEKYNHYNGLRGLSETVEALYHAVHNIERQLNSINQKLEILSRK